LAQKQWRALSTIAKPKSNLAKHSNGNGNCDPGRRCFICQGPGPLANRFPNCKNNMSSESTVQTSNKSARPLEESKYCQPADSTKALPIYGKNGSSVPNAYVEKLVKKVFNSLVTEQRIILKAMLRGIAYNSSNQDKGENTSDIVTTEYRKL